MDQEIWKVASKLNPGIISKIKRMTDRNHHSEALIEGAKMLGYSHLAKKLELIGELHKLEGHLPRPLGDYQYSLYKDMMKAAERDLTPEEFTVFNGAY